MTQTVLEAPDTKMNSVAALLPIDDLKPHEMGSPLYFAILRREIIHDGFIRYPIAADEKSRVILDGMHRWLVLKSLGCTVAPVILVDSNVKSLIYVGRRRINRYRRNPDQEIPIETVIQRGLQKRLMKPRTTRHFFPFPKFQPVNLPLHSLIRNTPVDISEYLAPMTEKDCESAIREWLNEITEELEFLADRQKEVLKERTELLNRLKNTRIEMSAF